MKKIIFRTAHIYLKVKFGFYNVKGNFKNSMQAVAFDDTDLIDMKKHLITIKKIIIFSKDNIISGFRAIYEVDDLQI